MLYFIYFLKGLNLPFFIGYIFDQNLNLAKFIIDILQCTQDVLYFKMCVRIMELIQVN